MGSSIDAPLKRLAAIDREIKSGTYPTCERLAQALGCDVRSVKRNLTFLRSELGAPIKRRHWSGGSGYYYARPWSCRRAVLRYLGFED